FCSRDLIKAGTFAGRHDAPRAYASLDEVLYDDEVVAVYLATPNALHADQAVACLKGGRNVLTDKPIALSSIEARRIMQAAAGARRTVGVMHQQRFHPANIHAIRLMDEGTLGTLRSVRADIGIWYPPVESPDDPDHRRLAWRLDPRMSGGGA